jgi:hypothetical protein
LSLTNGLAYSAATLMITKRFIGMSTCEWLCAFLVCENQRFNLRWSLETLCELFASHFATILSFNFIYNLTPIVSVLKHFYSSPMLPQNKLEGLSLANIFCFVLFLRVWTLSHQTFRTYPLIVLHSATRYFKTKLKMFTMD